MLEYVIDKVFNKKNIYSDYIGFFIVEVTQAILNLDNTLEKLKLEKIRYIMVLNLTPLHLEVLNEYIKCFIKIKIKLYH